MTKVPNCKWEISSSKTSSSCAFSLSFAQAKMCQFPKLSFLCNVEGLATPLSEHAGLSWQLAIRKQATSQYLSLKCMSCSRLLGKDKEKKLLHGSQFKCNCFHQVAYVWLDSNQMVYRSEVKWRSTMVTSLQNCAILPYCHLLNASEEGGCLAVNCHAHLLPHPGCHIQVQLFQLCCQSTHKPRPHFPTWHSLCKIHQWPEVMLQALACQQIFFWGLCRL